MKISIIHPSYGRPELAMKTASNWLTRAKNPKNIQYLICLSRLDPLRKQYDEWIKELSTFNQGRTPENYGFGACYHEAANMVIQMNHAAKLSDGELIIAVSDDFDCPEGWDEQLIKGIAGRKDFVLRIDDGVRNPGVQTKKIIPLPIMDRAYYERFKFIYHPQYNHFYGDEELFRVGVILGRKIELPIIFQHVHPVTGKVKKDHVNVKNNAFHETDHLTFLRRELKGFDLKTVSILIPSIASRDKLLFGLLKELYNQIHRLKVLPLVEVLTCTDNGEDSIGKKRNALLKNATGDYIQFIDDDDKPSENYIAQTLAAIQDEPDCCSLNGIIFLNSTPRGTRTKIFKHSIQFKGWYEKDDILYRFPNHLNCVKASIAKKMTFPDISHGEDKVYSQQLEASGLLKKEAVIDQPLYLYYPSKK